MTIQPEGERLTFDCQRRESFCLMPFSKNFDDVYKFGIKAACNNIGVQCERVDEQLFQEYVTDRIFAQIRSADMIIADMTRRNPNVFYEVGYAHALDKLTILLTSTTDDIPFDLRNRRHLIYNNSIDNLHQ
jgi:nucleoside 2-deoxyribosyltransferase